MLGSLGWGLWGGVALGVYKNASLAVHHCQVANPLGLGLALGQRQSYLRRGLGLVLLIRTWGYSTMPNGNRANFKVHEDADLFAEVMCGPDWSACVL